ncbi:hypothetical protein TWF281_006874 [Arthrobotrys megalospora]
MVHILSLPIEIQTEILRHIPWEDHYPAALVSPLWEAILTRRDFSSKRYYDYSRTPRSPDPSYLSTIHRLSSAGSLVLEIAPNEETEIFELRGDNRSLLKIPGGQIKHPTGEPHKDFRRTRWAPGALLNIGSLFSSDKLGLFTTSLDESESDDADNPTTLKKVSGQVAFQYNCWRQYSGIFQQRPFVAKGYQSEELMPTYEQYDWHLGDFHSLFEVIKTHLKKHIKRSRFLGCWCILSGAGGPERPGIDTNSGERMWLYVNVIALLNGDRIQQLK